MIPTGWSWRYGSGSTFTAAGTQHVTLPEKETGAEEPVTADFTRTMLNPRWLDGNAYADTPES